MPTTQSDTPASRDSLNRTHAANTLAELMLSAGRRPHALAIFGSWGAGKSTTVGLLERALRARWRAYHAGGGAKLVIANFNAWDYEQVDNIAAAVAQSIANALAQQTSRWRLKLRFAWANHRSLLLGALGRIALGALVTLGGAYLALKGIEAKATWQQVLGGGFGSVGIAAMWGLVRGARGVIRLLEHPTVTKGGYLDLPNFRRHLGLAPTLRRDLGQLAALALGDNGQLVVVIDDVDRCRVNTVVAVFEAMRLVASFEGVSVVIAVDERVVMPVLASRYEDLAKLGGREARLVARDYLGKLVATSIRLGELPRSAVTRFIDEDLFGTGAATAHSRAKTEPPTNSEMVDTPQQVRAFATAATTYQLSNPRQLRRLRNAFRLLKGLYAHDGDEIGANYVQLLVWQESVAASSPTLHPPQDGPIRGDFVERFGGPENFEIALARVRTVLLPSASPE